MAIEDQRFFQHGGLDTARHPARRGHRRRSRRSGRGRLDDHPAAGPQPLHRAPEEDARTQDRRSEAGARVLRTPLQAPDPRPVPEHRDLRDDRRRHRGRRRRRLPDLLLAAGLEARHGADGAARGPPAGALRVQPAALPRGGEGAPQRGAAEDGEARLPGAARGAGARDAGARARCLPWLLRPPPALLLRLRRTPADRALRRQHRCARAASRSTPRSSRSCSGSGWQRCTRRCPTRPTRPRHWSRSTPATATSGRWSPAPTTAQNQFNLAAQGHRQPGSTFKAFVLTTAIKQGIDPYTTYYESKPLDLNLPQWGHWEVHTADEGYQGTINLKQATVTSDNTVFAQLDLDVGPENVAATAKSMGITTPLQGLPAEGIGGLRVRGQPARTDRRLRDAGLRRDPPPARSRSNKVVLPGGKVDHPAGPASQAVLSPAVAWQVTRLLHDNITEGTGTAAYTGCVGQAGKTGTTDDYTDAWFSGYQPNLATAVWVGYPQSNAISMTDVHGITVFGGTFPAEIWHSVYATPGCRATNSTNPKKKSNGPPATGQFTAAAPGTEGAKLKKGARRRKVAARAKKNCRPGVGRRLQPERLRPGCGTRTGTSASAPAPADGGPEPGMGGGETASGGPDEEAGETAGAMSARRPIARISSHARADGPKTCRYVRFSARRPEGPSGDAGRLRERQVAAITPGLAYGLIWAGFLAYLGVLATAPRLGGRVVGALILGRRPRLRLRPGPPLPRRLQLPRLRAARRAPRPRPLRQRTRRRARRPRLRPRHLDRNPERLRPPLHPRDLSARLAADLARRRDPEGARRDLGPRPRLGRLPPRRPGAASTRSAPPPSSPSTPWSSSTWSAAPTTTAWRCSSPPSASRRSSSAARHAPARPSSRAPRSSPPASSSPPSPSSPPCATPREHHHTFERLPRASPHPLPMGRKPAYMSRFRPIGGGCDETRAGRSGACRRGARGGAVLGWRLLAFGWDWLHAFGLPGKTRGGRAISRSRSPSPG